MNLNQYKNNLRIAEEEELPIVIPKVPLGTYQLNRYENFAGEYYQLDRIEDLTLPSKLYGDFSIIERVLKSFESNNTNLTVFLAGIKGSGKTITAKLLCITSKLPVIVINAPHNGVEFQKFLNSPLLDGCVVFIDEFEKLYSTKRDKENPTKDDTTMLQILDGTRSNKKLFVLTSNNETLGDLFTNRLGRVKYREIFTYLSAEIVEQIGRDALKDLKHLPSLLRFHKMFKKTTYDILVNVIRDINLFNEDAMEVSKYMNIEFESIRYKLTIEDPQKRYFIAGSEIVYADPKSPTIRIERYINERIPRMKNKVQMVNKITGELLFDIEEHYLAIAINKEEIVEVDNRYIWQHNDGYNIVFTEDINPPIVNYLF